MTWHRRPAEGCVTILHACVLVWGCAGNGRVLAVPAAGAGDMVNYSVSLIGLGRGSGDVSLVLV
jgi:hypothetical protein